VNGEGSGRGIARRAGLVCLAGLALLACLATACAGGGGEAHDALSTSHDVRVDAPQASGSSQGYEYVARRPLGVVALAEARGIDPVVAHAAIDRVADALDACATEEGRKGTLVDGAARVVVQIDESGNVAGTNVHFDPGAGVAQNAVVCFVAPVRMLTFPPAAASARRGLAIEALWGRVIPQGPPRSP
jgi:hypothetical protein